MSQKLFDEEEKAEEKSNTQEDVQWVKDEAEGDAEVLKLDVGDSITGILVDKFQSVKYECGLYKIKKKDDEKVKILIGTTILDKMLAKREVGELIKVERHPDQKSASGRTYQNYEVYHKKN
jgi:hypothetical protein